MKRPEFFRTLYVLLAGAFFVYLSLAAAKVIKF